MGIVSLLVLESILNICSFHGIWFRWGGTSIASLSLEVTDSARRPTLNPVATKTRSGTPPWGMSEAGTRLGSPSMPGRSCECDELPPPSGCGLSSLGEGSHSWGNETAKQMILLRGQNVWKISLVHLSDSSWHEKTQCVIFSCFKKNFFSVVGILSFPQQDTIPCWRGEGRLHLFVLETWENCFRGEDFSGLAGWLIRGQVKRDANRKSFLAINK